MGVFTLFGKTYLISLGAVVLSFLMLIGYFIWGAFQTERIRKIVYRLGKDDIDRSDIEELINFLEKHDVPLKFYARDLLKAAYELVEKQGDKLDEELKQKLHRNILRRGILV